MTHRTHILILETDDFSPHVIEELRGWAEVDLGWPADRSIADALASYDVCWFRLAHRIDRSVLHAGSRCRTLVTPVTGIDHIDEVLCAELGVEIICLRGEREFLREVRATAEMTIGLTIALMRHIPPAAASVERGEWDRDRFRGHELYRKTAGIIGYGRLGQITAEYFRALGMRVLAYDIAPPDDTPDAAIELVDDLPTLLQTADVISLHVTYHAATHHLIGAEELAHCRPTAYLVNTSRGGLIDETALLEALDEGRLAGAALDVLQGEPAVAENALIAYARTHDNLLIVPHIGGNTYESFTKTERFMAQKLKAHLSM